VRHGIEGKFSQSELDWIVSTSMKKKIFALLLRNGWIRKNRDNTYNCSNPADAIRGLLNFRVPEVIVAAKKDYSFTQNSAVEIWSDYSYVQRGMEKSPYFVKVLEKDLRYWKNFLNSHDVSNYVKSGTTIGEFVILMPVKSLRYEEKEGLKVDTLRETINYAKSNDAYAYAYEYIKKKYGSHHEY
jgi:hypothetical protein